MSEKDMALDPLVAGLPDHSLMGALFPFQPVAYVELLPIPELSLDFSKLPFRTQCGGGSLLQLVLGFAAFFSCSNSACSFVNRSFVKLPSE